MRRAAVGLFATFCGVLAFAFGPVSNADATWDSGHCSGTRHCYGVTTWNVSSPRHLYDTWTYIDTTSVYVPEPSQYFVNDEQWVSWAVPYARDWIESGQSAGGEEDSPPNEIYEFYAINNAVNKEEPEREEEYEEVSGPLVSLNTRNLYQFYVPKESGESREGAHWCIKWGAPLYPTSEEGKVRCFVHLHGPAAHLEQGVEAATEEEPTNTAFAEGYAEGGKEDLWWNAAHPGQHSELEPEAGATCATEHLPGYGSLNYGAGKGCPPEGDDGGVADGDASSPSVADPFARYALETGAKISIAKLEQIACQQAELGGDALASPSFSQGSLEGALEIIRPGSMAGVHANASSKEREYLEGEAYLVELEGTFTLVDARMPPGQTEPPAGTVLRLVIDAHTGRIEARWLGGRPAEPIGDLGPTEQLDL